VKPIRESGVTTKLITTNTTRPKAMPHPTAPVRSRGNRSLARTNTVAEVKATSK